MTDTNRIDMGKIKGAIFDIDGTLLDSMSIWANLCTRYLLSKGIRDFEKDLDERVAYLTFEEGCDYLKTNYLNNESSVQIRRQISEMIRDFYYYEALLKPGVADFVNSLYMKKIPMVLASTSDEDLVFHALERVGIVNQFSKLLTCDMFNTSKRDNLIFNKAKSVIEEFHNNADIDNSNIFVFEDSLTSIKTCRKIGFSIVGIRDEYSKKDWREIEVLSDICIDSFEELTKNI